MKTVEEFKAYYQEQLLPSLQVLDASRRNKLFWVRRMTLALIPVFFVSTLMLYTFKPFLPWWGAAGLSFFFCFSFLTCVYGMALNGYNKEFTAASVTKKILTFINPSLVHYKNVRILLDTILKSGIFSYAPYYITGSDYIAGTIGKTKIAFSHINVHFRRSSGFRGIFFVADFNKNFKGRTIVLPDTAQRLFGEWLGAALQSMNNDRGMLVKLEDPEFEKLFAVYGDDQIEARYILSPGLMERITSFRSKAGRVVCLSFVENKLMMAIPSVERNFIEHLLDWPLSRTALDYPQLEDYFNHVELFVGIVEDLNLNTRIWGEV